MYRLFHPNTAKYTFFSSAHRTFSRMDYILGHKTSLDKLKRTEIQSSIYTDHNSIKLDITRKLQITNTWRLKVLFNNQ